MTVRRDNLPPAIIGPIQMREEVACDGIPGVGGIYRITCKALHRHYIGQTTDLARRWLEHQVQLRQGTHQNSGLQAAYNRFGPFGFTFYVLQVFQGRYDETVYTLAEQRHMDAHVRRNHASYALFNVRAAGTDNWLKSTEAGRVADQAASFRRAQFGKHPRNKDHL